MRKPAPEIIPVIPARVAAGHLVYVPRRNLYAKVTGVQDFPTHRRFRWVAISPVPLEEDDTGLLIVDTRTGTVPCVRRADAPLLYEGIGLEAFPPAPSGCRTAS